MTHQGAGEAARGRTLLLVILVAATVLAGTAWLVSLLATTADTGPTSVASTALFTGLVLVAGLFPLPVGPRVNATVTTAPLFAAALVLAPGNAALAAAVGTLGHNVLSRFVPRGLNLPWYKHPFNTAESALSTGVASLLFHVLGGEVPSAALPSLPAAVVMYALNTGLVSTVASIHEGHSLPRLWWQGTRADGPAEAGLFAFGLLGAAAFTLNPALYLVVLALPVGILYLAFSGLASANARLERALEDLRELGGRMVSVSKLASVGSLSLDLAHQVRNPLFIVVARLDRLQSHLEPHHPLRPDVDRALEGALRIQQLTDNLLAMARLQWVSIDVAVIVEDAVGMALVNPAQHPPVLRSLPKDLPRVQGNPVLLREALSNLVANALEASPSGRPVTVRAASQNGTLVIEIEDSGAGIPADRLAHLFEPFQTSKAGGLGLGLFSARHIVAMHQGSLEVQSQEGQGTLVTVRLPAVPREA